MTAYWLKPLDLNRKMSTEIHMPLVQSAPMQIVGRSTGGLQILCISQDSRLYMLMNLENVGWSVVGEPMSVVINSIDELHGACFSSGSIFIVLRTVSVDFNKKHLLASV